MPTTHTWKGTTTSSSGPNPWLFDSNQYTDSQPFEPGDTLVVNGGEPGVASVNGNVSYLYTGTFLFNASRSSGVGLVTDNIGLDAASTLAASGPGQFVWQLFDQFINDGTVQVGSPQASANVLVSMGSPGAATLTNNSAITVYDSVLKLEPIVQTTGLVNSAGATVSASDGGGIILSSIYGYGVGDDCNVTNNGVMDLNGAAGTTTAMVVQGSYQGSGLLSVRGAAGDNAASTYTNVVGPASGIFDVESGELKFSTTPVGGFVNFLDNNGVLYDNYNFGDYQTGNPFGATIYGFQAGDQIDVYGDFATYINNYSLSWNASTNVLTVFHNGGSFGQFHLAGSYQQSDFQLQAPGNFNVTDPLVITTTNTANAIPGFAYLDTTTQGVGSQEGAQYAGPVSYLQSEFLWPTAQDGVNVTAHVPDAYVVGGAGNDALAANSGSNVLDGGTGSNFLAGASGADGGVDTFFLDASAGTTWDTITNFHPGDSVTLWGFVPGQSGYAWADNDGAAGYTGATLHAAVAGAGTPVNASVTFAGLSLATAQSQFSVSSGTAGGRTYLYVHDNG